MRNDHKVGIVLMLIIIGLLSIAIATSVVEKAHGAEPERNWYSFQADDACIEINADSVANAHCGIATIVEERNYNTYKFLMFGCPGILADDYFYDFTFECYKK